MLVGAQPGGDHPATVPDPGGEVANAWGRAPASCTSYGPTGCCWPAGGPATCAALRARRRAVAWPGRATAVAGTVDPDVTLPGGEARREAAWLALSDGHRRGARRRPRAVPGPGRPAARRPGRPRRLPGGRVRRGLRPLTSPRRTHGFLPFRGRRPAQAPHPAPQSRGRPVLRGADGRGGLLLRLLAALPRQHPLRGRRRAAVGAARPDADAEPPAHAPALLHPRALPGRRLRPTRSTRSPGGAC